MGLSMYHDGGTKVRAVDAGGHRLLSSSVAGGNGTASNGNSIDRRDDYRHLYESAVLVVVGTGRAVAAASGAMISVKMQHSNDETTWVDLASLEGTTTYTTDRFDSDNSVVLQINYRMNRAMRYVRAVMTTTHSADSAPDTATNPATSALVGAMATLLFCGADQTPADSATSDLGSITTNNAIAQLGA